MRSFASLREAPTHDISVGMGNLLEADEVLLLAAGEERAAALRALLEGPVTTAVPVSALREHPAVTVLVAPELAEQSGLAD